MIAFLSKIFIKNNHDYTSPQVRTAYGMLCGIVGILLNLLLCGAKFAAGALTGSVAITADALNNLSDAGSSVVTLLGFKLASQKPDHEHPFGHGRMEYVSGLIVSFLILIMGYELAKSSIQKIIEPVAVEFSVLSVLILAGSVLVKVYMAFYNFRIGKKIASAAMKATAVDSLSDCISTGLVLVSILLNRIFGINIDAYCGIIVALLILYAGFSAAKDTINPLLGQKPSPEFVGEVEHIIQENPHIINIHDLIVHDYGPGRKMISVHAEVSAEGDILFLHDSIDNTERRLSAKLGCDAVIHLDPVSTDDPKITDLSERVINVLKTIDERLTMHDFRMVDGPTHTNLIFDVVVPVGFSMSDVELKKKITDEILNFEDGTYFSVITVDKSYC